MWGFGGRHYWGRRETGDRDTVEGIVVVFAWSSSEEKYLKNYSNLYSSLGWNSLICHSQFLNHGPYNNLGHNGIQDAMGELACAGPCEYIISSFASPAIANVKCVPETAASLASIILVELVKELKIRPCPVVFASFSGGPKACMYKVLQIIEGKCESNVNPDEYQLVRDCVSGHIFDSCPIDFTSYTAAQFLVHPRVLKISCPPLLASWIANCISSSLDALFLRKFELQRTEYWQTLYSSASMGAPYLILCSEDDSISSSKIISNFAQELESLGGDVKLMKWSRSEHVAHYRHHPLEYKAAVTELLRKATVTYSAAHANRIGHASRRGGD